MNSNRKFIQFNILSVGIIASLLFAAWPCNGLSQDQQNIIHFEARNEPLRSVLNRLSANHNINITYNASDDVFDVLVNYTTSRHTPVEILRDILNQNGHEFRESGNHLVILKSTAQTRRPSDTPSGQSPPTTKTPSKEFTSNEISELKSEPFAEMRVLHDTIFIRDTIVRIEQQIIRDTVFVERPLQREITRPETLVRDLLGVEINGRERWAVGLSFTQMMTNYQFTDNTSLTPELEKVKQAESFSIRNFGLGVSLQYNTGSLSIIAGMAINSFAHRFDYSELFSSGGFNRIDTLDSFFVIQQNDTIWTHITDTIYIPLESQEIFYERMNRMGFWETSLAVTWDFYAGRNFVWYARGNFHASTPLWLNAQSIQNSEGYPAVNVNRDNFSPWLLAWSGGLGAKIRLNSISDIFAETWYRRYLNTWNENHPLERRMHGGGIRLGILYYF